MAAEMILEQFQLATDSFTKLLVGVRPDQLATQTPCPEWSVQELISHVTKGNLMFTRLITGAEPPAVNGAGDAAAAVTASAKALLEAASTAGAMERTFVTPMGERNGARLMIIRIVELPVHGWDLATATDQRLEVDERVIETAFAHLRPMLSGDRAGMPYGPERTVSPDAAAIDRLAAFAGRAVVAA
jgi:uncharacterized protein (TIGR03086 family)